MESRTIKIPNVGCSGCVSTIKSEISQVAGVIAVDGNSDTKMVTIQWDIPAVWTAIKNRLIEIDYAPEEG